MELKFTKDGLSKRTKFIFLFVENFFPHALKTCRVFFVFRYSFSEAIPIFFNRLKSGFFPCPIAIKFSPVIGYGLKFVKM